MTDKTMRFLYGSLIGLALSMIVLLVVSIVVSVARDPIMALVFVAAMIVLSVCVGIGYRITGWIE